MPSLVQNDIEVFRGDDFSVQLVFTDTDQNVIDITGWTIFFTAKKRREDPDDAAVLTITAAPSDPLNGIALITKDHTYTDALLGTYYYDFQYKKADNTVQTITSGSITFNPDITRRIS